MSSLTRGSYGQDAPRSNLSTPGFLIPDACYAIHRNPRITIFTRHNRIGSTVHHPLQTIIVLQIVDLTIKSDYNSKQRNNNSVVEAPSSWSQAMLTMGDD